MSATKKYIIFILIIILSIPLHAQERTAYLYQVDPLHKVLKEETYIRDQVDTLRAVRGQVVSVQIVIKAVKEIQDMSAKIASIKSEYSNLRNATCGWVGYIHVGRSYTQPSDNIIRSVSGYYPDPILPDSLFNIESGEIQPLWISIPIDKKAAPGCYKGTVIISGQVDNKTEQWSKDFYIRVYPITLDKSPLLVTNWSFHCDPTIMSYMNNDQEVKPYSDLYWELLKTQAKTMASHRQNVYRVFPTWNTKYTYNNGIYTFDFTNLDHEIEIFEKTGTLERLEGGDHLAYRSGGWDSPFYVELPLPDNADSQKLMLSGNPVTVSNGMRFVKLPLEDERSKNFLNQFLPALKKHLVKKGWYDIFLLHVADEPIASNAESYNKICQYVKALVPDIKTIDAVMTSKEVKSNINVMVPLLDVFKKDYSFYQEQQKAGKDIWFYTCLNPKGNFPNRFIELPLIQTRFIHWLNYKYNATGYLHWGLNAWIKDQLHTDTSLEWDMLPAGDNCIIYPGYRKIYSSIRFETMRDGIDDYQLFKMIEKRDPQKAKDFVNALIKDFEYYESSIPRFREVYKQMLEYLCTK